MERQLALPHLGYMALIRNLRNLDDAGISDEIAAGLAARIADPRQVRRSRQLPYRFLSARSKITPVMAGALFGVALAAKVSGLTCTGSPMVCSGTRSARARRCSGRPPRSVRAWARWVTARGSPGLLRHAAGCGEGREGACAQVGGQLGHLMAINGRSHHAQDDAPVFPSPMHR